MFTLFYESSSVGFIQVHTQSDVARYFLNELISLEEDIFSLDYLSDSFTTAYSGLSTGIETAITLYEDIKHK